MRKHVLLCLMFAALRCASPNAPVEIGIGEPFQLQYGQTAILHHFGFSITFTAVDEDSRCPDGAMCFWAGNAKVAVVVSRKRLALNTTLEPREASYQSYKIVLLSVSPNRNIQDEIKLNDYKITLVVTKP